ncbi:PglZ domain-containing protein [Parabacteroides sp.]
MTQERIYSYFQRNPQLHVLFIFDKANIIMNDLADCLWGTEYIYKVFDGAWFNAKYNIEYTWKEKRVVLLFPLGTYPISEEQQLKFPLMDMLKANMEYKEEDYAAFMQQYNLPEKFRAFISRHIGELMSNKINAMLKDRFTSEAFSEDVVVRGFISSYLGEKRLLEWENIIIRMFILGLDSENKKRLDFYHRLGRNKDAKKAIDERLIRIFGFSYNPNQEEKVKELVESLKYNSITQLLDVVADDPYKAYKIKSSIALEQMNRIYEQGTRDRQFTDKFTKLMKGLGADIREKELITIYGMEASFYYLTEELGWPILQEIASNKLVTEPAEMQERLRLLSQKLPTDSVLQQAINFLMQIAFYYEMVRGLGSMKLNTPEAYVQLYTNDLYRLDTFYRCALEEYHELLSKDVPIFTCLNGLKQKFDEEYARMVNVLNLEWMTCVVEKGNCFDGLSLKKQEDFYANECGSSNKQVIIISDALRYEVAAELMQALAKEKHIAKLSAYRAMLPTETKYCKPALLPHASLIWKNKEMLVDGEVLDTLENRSVQVAKYREDACCVDYETVIKADVKTARALFKRPLVYIFHDTIDAASHGAGAGDVIAACRKAIEQLAVLIRRLHASWNVANVMLTADHGFLYNDVEFAEKDKHAVTAMGVIEKKTRYYVSDQATAQEGVVTMLLDKVSGMKTDLPLYVGVPMGTNRLAASGGYSFAHGGATLQEMLIPVIHSSQKRSDKTNKVGVALIDHNLVMVSSRVKFLLIQSEAVSMTVIERKVVCQVYQGDTPVTGEQTITLNSTDTNNLNNRVYEVVLTLKHSVSSGMLQLRVYDEEDRLNPLIKEVVKNNTIIEQDF